MHTYEKTIPQKKSCNPHQCHSLPFTSLKGEKNPRYKVKQFVLLKHTKDAQQYLS